MVLTIKAGMKDCSHVKTDWKKLKEMALVLESPHTFAYHVGKDLVVNGRDIYQEVNTAVADYKAQDWAGFGYNVGEAAAKTILGEQKKPKTATIKEFSAPRPQAHGWSDLIRLPGLMMSALEKRVAKYVQKRLEKQAEHVEVHGDTLMQHPNQE